jgi:hypothetical protein
MTVREEYRERIAGEGDNDSLIGIIADYIERDSECMMPIVVHETKRDYGIRLLKTLANEIRTLQSD